MFTGIIEGIARIKSIAKLENGKRAGWDENDSRSRQIRKWDKGWQ